MASSKSASSLASARAHAHSRHAEAYFDLLADKIMCDHCRNKYPLGPYYFQEYKAYVTKAEVERVRAESSAEYVDPAKNATACYDEYRAQEYRTAMLDKKIDGPLIADDEDIAEQQQVPSQDPVSTMLGSVVTAVSADFDPARYAARCIIGDGSEANFGIFESAWQQIEYRECRRQAPLSMLFFRKVRHSEAHCPVPIQGRCMCVFPDDWERG
jgi:hypothetical protein